jgi:hypothetical protein
MPLLGLEVLAPAITSPEPLESVEPRTDTDNGFQVHEVLQNGSGRSPLAAVGEALR